MFSNACVTSPSSTWACFILRRFRSNAIAPGAINTDMLQLAYQAIAEAEGISVHEAAEMENAGIALRRPAEPEEIAEVVVGVAMSGGAYLTGIAIPVSGGMMPGL